ncbi:tetratricopeptide repeat protein [Octadecabacter sp. R77987]|uniref:tetratricopeptide repeat protein n=1 Tax=Octadecabacter sp. R77987 TaxID=3093874 RepID=UPI00366B907F
MPRKPIQALLISTAVSLAPALSADPNPGAYLAARQAGINNDYLPAAEYFMTALAADPGNPLLLENALASQLGLGNIQAARALSQQMIDIEIDSQIAHMVEMAAAAQDNRWDDIFAHLETGRSVGPLVDGIAQAWAFIGQGDMSAALTAFDEVTEAQGLRAFGLYHKALALASVGDFEGADAIFSLPPQQGLQRTRRIVLIHATILSQLDRNADAVTMLDDTFGPQTDPAVAGIRARLDAGETVRYGAVTTPTQGIGEVMFSVAGALQGESGDAYTLFYARLAEYLNPTNSDALILSAQLLEGLERYELASATYARVPRDDSAFFAAELGRAEVLRRDGKVDAAVEVLQQLARSYPDQPFVKTTLGDALRSDGRHQDANTAYTEALALYGADHPDRWWPLYTRGITFERMGNWPSAEADLRAALDLQPDNPNILNYLGYTMVEEQVNLDEALAMIEKAAAARPDSGAITDSLGWVLYRLGRFDEAVEPMERAAALEPVDPIINDHLGDVFWAVGRDVEARFQWQRALSFDPEAEDANRIRRKLEIGLDAVLIEEGADPIRVANDDG